MSLREFSINLVSNASMTTFPENTLSQFTTLLPQQLNLSGFWEVALVEIAWPAAIQNITYGQFKYRVAAENSQNYGGGNSSENRKRKLGERPYGLVTMYQPPIRSVQETFVETITNIKPGVYLSVDQILLSICKKIFVRTVGDTFPLSWKLDAPSEALKVYYEGNKQECMFLETISQDLQNVLGMKTLIDCSRNNKSTKEGNNRQAISKNVGKFPTDLSGGWNTIFLYCDLVQNEILGDSRTALLRAIPLTERSTTGNHQQQNYRTFNNLQWRRIVKSSIESISVSLRNETGQLVPFLSRGRTNLTLHFRQRIEQ